MAFEAFRKQALSEGSESLTLEKLNPDQFDGQIWMAYEGNTVASISAVECSHYTGNHEVGRICRYHILKQFRHGRYGFKMLPHQYKWAKENNYSMLYWTHDIRNKALNALYQKRRRFGSSTDYYFDCPVFKSFTLHPELLFKVSDKSDFLQYIYYSNLKTQYVWTPKKCVVPY